jgi:hypothetical protein
MQDDLACLGKRRDHFANTARRRRRAHGHGDRRRTAGGATAGLVGDVEFRGDHGEDLVERFNARLAQ